MKKLIQEIQDDRHGEQMLIVGVWSILWIAIVMVAV